MVGIGVAVEVLSAVVIVVRGIVSLVFCLVDFLFDSLMYRMVVLKRKGTTVMYMRFRNK